MEKAKARQEHLRINRRERSNIRVLQNIGIQVLYSRIFTLYIEIEEAKTVLFALLVAYAIPLLVVFYDCPQLNCIGFTPPPPKQYFIKRSAMYDKPSSNEIVRFLINNPWWDFGVIVTTLVLILNFATLTLSSREHQTKLRLWCPCRHCRRPPRRTCHQER